MKLKALLILSQFLAVSVGYSQINPSYNLKQRFDGYIGSPVYLFLLDDSVRRYRYTMLIDEPPAVLNHAELAYTKGIEILIYTEDFKYVSPESDSLKWDVKLFYKEQIRTLILLDNGKRVFISSKDPRLNQLR